MFAYVNDIFLVVWEVICCKIFMEAFSVKRNAFHDRYRYAVLGLLIVADYAVFALFTDYFVFKEFLVVIFGSLVMWFYFNQKYSKSVVLFLLYQGMVLVIDYLTLVILRTCFQYLSLDILQLPIANSLVSAIGKMILFCFVIVIKKNFEKNTTDILKREMQIREYHLFQECVKNETEMYRIISENYEKQRRRVHEYKNQMSCIVTLASGGKYEELNRYLKKIDDDMRENIDMIDTNHVIVNAVLNTKYREARGKGILVVLKVNDLSSLKIEDKDIVIVLSNLLNNAIEACEFCENKMIKIKFVNENDNVILSVVNSMEKKPIVMDGKFQTSKTKNQEEHGIGIENTISVIKKYGGSYVINNVEGKFRFTIMIK